MDLTQQEIQNLVYFLNKAQILGNESMAHALLMQKLSKEVVPGPVKEKKDDKPTK